MLHSDLKVMKIIYIYNVSVVKRDVQAVFQFAHSSISFVPRSSGVSYECETELFFFHLKKKWEWTKVISQRDSYGLVVGISLGSLEAEPKS